MGTGYMEAIIFDIDGTLWDSTSPVFLRNASIYPDWQLLTINRQSTTESGGRRQMEAIIFDVDGTLNPKQFVKGTDRHGRLFTAALIHLLDQILPGIKGHVLMGVIVDLGAFAVNTEEIRHILVIFFGVGVLFNFMA